MPLEWTCDICGEVAEYKKIKKYFCKKHWGEELGYEKKRNPRTEKGKDTKSK